MKYSINPDAEKIVGKRDLPKHCIPFDQPCELNYRCPVCQSSFYNDFDERLHWGEYNGFLWCSVCNLDIPACFCVPDLHRLERKPGTKIWGKSGLKDAIKIYLLCIEDAKKKNA